MGSFSASGAAAGGGREVPPVLLLIFNRPELAARTFAAIRAAHPARLFIAADGPRHDRPDDFRNCALARLAVQKTDWPCDVRCRFLEHNYGCRAAVSSAIDWFFREVEAGIILEDDCEPSPAFFDFCSEALWKYRDDERVMHVNGTVFHTPGSGRENAWFSRYALVWGWAGWRRAWRHCDVSLCNYPWERLPEVFPDPVAAKRWRRLLVQVRDGRPGFDDSWAFPWSAALFARGAVAVSPPCNLVVNRGTAGGTHRMPGAAFRRPVVPEGKLSFAFPDDCRPDDACDAALFRDIYRLPPWPLRAFRKLMRLMPEPDCHENTTRQFP